MTDSTKAPVRRKRKRSIPLTLRDDGRYCKKVHGKIYYFAGPEQAALKEWAAAEAGILAGIGRPIAAEGLTVAELCDVFLQSLEKKQEAGKITNRHLKNCKWACDILVAAWKHRAVASLTGQDFGNMLAAYAKGKSPVSAGSLVRHVRMVFKFGITTNIPNSKKTYITTPVDFGQDFKGPSKKDRRKFKREKGEKLFSAEDLRRILAAAPVQLKAMIYLGINAGFGNSDCGTLPQDKLDLEGGWCNYHRPKTEISRRCKLWPETIEALQAAIKARPTPKDKADESLTFITKYGESWAKDDSDNPISKAFRKLLNALKLHRPGLGFYTLRHVFRTEAGDAKDVEEIRYVMGHTSEHVEGEYIEKVPDPRLEAVANVVHDWLFPAAT